MFDRSEVGRVIDSLRRVCPYFVSEAHLQMTFALEVAKLNNKYIVIPEYPIKNNKGHDEIDLVIIDGNDNKKTLIEFKHRTYNTNNKNKLFVDICYGATPIFSQFSPRNHGAQPQACYDCWSDIKRLEDYIVYGQDKQFDKGFFIFITNDGYYWKNQSIKVLKYNGYYLSPMNPVHWTDGHGNPITSKTANNKQKKSLGYHRLNEIKINGNYCNVNFKDFVKPSGTVQRGRLYKILIVEIEK